MRRYAPKDSQAQDSLTGCRWLVGGLIAVNLLITMNLYVMYCWNSPQWVYWLVFCIVGVAVSVWQTYHFFPLVVLRKQLQDRSILRVSSAIAKKKWCWNGYDFVRVTPYNRHLLQDLCDGLLGEFCITRNYFDRKPSETVLEALRAEGEGL